jgi:4-hydroxy-tetrahydrodipicolinate reductase
VSAGAPDRTGPLRVAVLGAAGRMGTAACAAVEAADDLELVARVGRGDDVAAVTGAGADVAVELSVPEAAPEHVRRLVGAGVHVVVGTTGWDEPALERVRAQLADPATPRGVGVLVAPNFALGAVLLMRLAAQAAPWFESVEVVELHHPAKVDAPSGTAQHTAELVAAARRAAGVAPAPDATATGLDGARGARVDGVPVHSVRLRGLTASEEVLLGNPGEVLTLRHDVADRAAFMPGLLVGVRRVAEHPGLVVGLEHYLDVG